MVRGYASLGHPKKAYGIFEGMLNDGIEPSEHAMVAIVNACAESRQVRLAESIMEHCRKQSGSLPLAMYAAMMKVYSNSKSFRKICDLYAQMEKDGVTPDD